MTTPLAAKIAREYGTPCAVIDMDRVERNIARIQVACDSAGVANRPHIKTHKSPLLAQMQVAAGAKGITCQNLGKLNGANEHRPGTYIYNDRMQVAAGVASWDDCALNIYSTVVSRAGPDRGILDAGSKTLTSDTGGGLEGHGLILEHPEAKIARFAEEHGFLDLARSNTRPNVGDVVRIVPNHVCVVVNMMDEVVMVRGDEILGKIG